MERSDLISQSKDGYSARNLETLFFLGKAPVAQCGGRFRGQRARDCRSGHVSKPCALDSFQ